MTLSQTVGQRFCVGFATPEVPKDFRAFVRKTQIGSVILFSHNITSVSQVRALCGELQAIFMEETGRPGIIMADQEGGTVRRMPSDAVLMPGAMALAAAGGQDIRTASRIAGEELAAVGINMNLAPVADVNSSPVNPVISVRSYGDVPSRVGEACEQAILGLHDAGIYSCAKHFPGHGDTNIDSHLDLPMVDKPLEEMEKVELVPFKAAIRAGTDAVMTTHILFPQLESEKIPATMSRTIMTGLLREKLGFEGLILSDCMM
ncbi:MAG: glycoside hydrolase family 3 protein, partial [Clostridia bacterium]|nr:glycoside hydrolase family 3 protein [Clostridia bacterium]